MNFIHSGSYQRFVTLVARLFLAVQFGIAAFFKIVSFSSEAAMTAAVGVPFATVAVALALVLEVAGILALLTGYKIREMSLLLALYVMLLAVLFYHNWANQMDFGLFVSHLGLAAALLYVSANGKGK